MRKLIIATTAAACIATGTPAFAESKVNPCAATKPMQISQNSLPCAAGTTCAAGMIPCAADAGNPCNPCASMGCNPCNPCGVMPCSPCNPCAAANPCAVMGCNPCNPNQ